MASNSINDFKAAFKGGGARPNQFQVTGSFPGGVVGGSEAAKLTPFLISAASLPASTLGEIVVPYRGRQLKLAGDRTFETWNITVLNDVDFSLRNAFESWSNLISSHEGNSSALAAESYEYFQDWRIEQLSRNGDPIAEYKFIGCFPTSIGAIDVSHAASAEVESFTVALNYQYWTRRKNEPVTDGR